jgi:RNase P subunit RPR2
MNDGYQGFECRICGKALYSFLSVEQHTASSSEKFVELTCSSGHTDRYRVSELKVVRVKLAPAGITEHKLAKAAVG